MGSSFRGIGLTALVAALAFIVGSASVAVAGPVVSGLVGLVDASGNTARISADGAVRVQEETTKQPVARTFHVPTAGCSAGCASQASEDYVVPTGSRLVITDVTGMTTLLAGGKLVAVGLQIFQPIVGGYIFPYADWYGAPTLAATNWGIGLDAYSFSRQTELRVDAGTAVRGFAFGTEGSATIELRGYLVNVP